MTPIETVQLIYAAFGRGDIPAILECLAPDVEWECDTAPNPIPWLQPLTGRAQVPKFFDVLMSQCEIHHFQPKLFLGEGRIVVDLVDIEFTVRATGKRVVEHDEVHLWTFDDAGLVQRFRHRADTWQQALALQPG